MEKNVVVEKSLDFAVRIVKLNKYLCYDKKEFVLSKQLLRSGTSVGANIAESQNAQSNNDFISKMSIARKELSETMYWLELYIELIILRKKRLILFIQMQMNYIELSAV